MIHNCFMQKCHAVPASMWPRARVCVTACNKERRAECQQRRKPGQCWLSQCPSKLPSSSQYQSVFTPHPTTGLTQESYPWNTLGLHSQNAMPASMRGDVQENALAACRERHTPSNGRLTKGGGMYHPRLDLPWLRTCTLHPACTHVHTAPHTACTLHTCKPPC